MWCTMGGPAAKQHRKDVRGKPNDSVPLGNMLDFRDSWLAVDTSGLLVAAAKSGKHGRAIAHAQNACPPQSSTQVRDHCKDWHDLRQFRELNITLVFAMDGAACPAKEAVVRHERGRGTREARAVPWTRFGAPPSLDLA